MKYICSLFIFFIFLSGYSQKNTSQTFNAEQINQLYIYTEEVFKINVHTSNTQQVVLSSHSEGEYFNDIALNMELLEDKMVLTSKFREILQSGYDKLSAHKVFSLEIDLEIPEGMEVFIRSNNSSVTANGNFKALKVELKSGSCHLHNFLGNAIINTYNGPIEVTTQDAIITANSRNGEVILPKFETGKHVLKLTSINGDIRVLKN
ncbi:hypothetical protein L1I30_03560 [Gillisia sp. M10.2A]|uniref:Adhesin domain-containing protein n=1 Tax=Gillisia lutea TaxID=2909668 RepID=A0ABS9ECX8_9FLAO|nr:hypothetical protein [Gillisia lutea]MCF4100737.1 hypothetical protein [Gillisia lutea]